MRLGAFYSTLPSGGHLLDGLFQPKEATTWKPRASWGSDGGRCAFSAGNNLLPGLRCAHQEEIGMSGISLDFDWLAPAPQIFTRCDGRCFWPGDRRYRP